VVSDGSAPANIHISGPTFGFNVDYDTPAPGALHHSAQCHAGPQRRELNAALLAVAWAARPSGQCPKRSSSNNISIGTLGANLAAINIATASDLTINGAGFTLDGGNTFRGLFVFGGDVAIDNLNIRQYAGPRRQWGQWRRGGGAGLGAAVRCAAATISLDGVNFTRRLGVWRQRWCKHQFRLQPVRTAGGGGMGTSGRSGNRRNMSPSLPRPTPMPSQAPPRQPPTPLSSQPSRWPGRWFTTG